MQVDIILVEVSSVGQQEGEDLMQEQERDEEEGVHGAHDAAAWMETREKRVTLQQEAESQLHID